MFDIQFISGLSTGREALFVAGCRKMERRLFISVNDLHARHVLEKKLFGKIYLFALGLYG